MEYKGYKINEEVLDLILEGAKMKIPYEQIQHLTRIDLVIVANEVKLAQ